MRAQKERPEMWEAQDARRTELYSAEKKLNSWASIEYFRPSVGAHLPFVHFVTVLVDSTVYTVTVLVDFTLSLDSKTRGWTETGEKDMSKKH